MNDSEICKRIAEIEGLIISNHKVAESDLWVHIGYTENSSVTLFNPLTDKALCFDLMVKYDVRVEPSDCNAWIDNEDGYPEFEIIHHNGTLQQAICLAIIEAHKG